MKLRNFESRNLPQVGMNRWSTKIEAIHLSNMPLCGANSSEFVLNFHIFPRFGQCRSGCHEILCATTNICTTQLWRPILTNQVASKDSSHPWKNKNLALKICENATFLTVLELRYSHIFPGLTLAVNSRLCEPGLVAAIILRVHGRKLLGKRQREIIGKFAQLRGLIFFSQVAQPVCVSTPPWRFSTVRIAAAQETPRISRNHFVILAKSGTVWMCHKHYDSASVHPFARWIACLMSTTRPASKRISAWSNLSVMSTATP